MSTAGNPHTKENTTGSVGNALTRTRVVTETITDPTLGNGDGTYGVTLSNVRSVDTTGDVLGVSWSGSQKVTVDSVSGSSVTVLFESASGTDTYAAEGDGSLSGTLTVTVKA